MRKILSFIFTLFIGLTFNFSYASINSEVELKAEKLEIAVKAIFEDPIQKEKYYEPIKKLFVDCSKNSKKEVIKEACKLLIKDFDERFGGSNFSKDAIKVEIVKVVDGDTINVLLNGEVVSVRLIGVDSPESTTKRYGYIECYGVESSDYLDWILRGKTVLLEYDESQGLYDSYDRLLAYVFLNGENINEKIIKSGNGWEYTYDKPYKYQSDFKNAQAFAENNNYGLRNTCKGQRIPLKNEGANGNNNGKIKGNISNKGEKIYHIPGCSHYDKTIITESNGERWFTTESEAQIAGWRACID